MTDKLHLQPATKAAQALGRHEPTTGAVTPPLQPATTFARGADYGLPDGRSYARPSNPTFEPPEALLTALEGGATALLFGSGMAAATTVFQALVPGDHVVAPRVMYWGLRDWLLGFARDWGLSVDLVDMTDLGALAAAMRLGRTRLVWIETPANPTWCVTDIAGAAAIAHGAGARLAVDSTVATPVLTRPIEHGADLVMHSATKYLNGHSDVLAGALVTARADALWERIQAVRAQGGAVPGSFEAWLLLRGLRTLFLRVRESAASAQAIAEHFSGHPKLKGVLYPGLPGDPGHVVARRQMTGGFGGMLSIRVAGQGSGAAAAALAVAGRVRVWTRATSLGGVESLIEHRASIEGADSPAPPDLLRLSVGIEDSRDLIADLDQALDAL
ncbi:trans-sulfuration enzyme family protein [Rhodospirillaceae bacterium SYSU D60014]|uniref:trans-sulfuration enzyme family protein n=1 Tax=Virgifigura deserti TaxID=2268457 RepID=UPI000E671D24